MWHQRIELDIQGKHEDIDGLNHMAEELHQLISRVKEHCVGKVVLGGFSMGAHTALHAVYRSDVEVDACLALSSYLIRSSAVYKILDEQTIRDKPPLLMSHGLSDVTVPPTWSEETVSELQKRGLAVNLKLYEGLGHRPGDKMVSDAFSWIQSF